MNDKYKEQLSAFIDNEIGPKALSELESDSSLLHRYQLMGDAIKGDLCDASLIDVSAQVSMAIENEPAYSAGSIKTEQVKTSQQSSSARPLFDFGAWLRPVGGVAVAASVAVVMVMVMNQPETNGIGVNGAGGQIAIDTRPVVSLPVSNVKHNISDTINTGTVNNKDEGQSEEDLKKLKKKALNISPQNAVSQ